MHVSLSVFISVANAFSICDRKLKRAAESKIINFRRNPMKYKSGNNEYKRKNKVRYVSTALASITPHGTYSLCDEIQNTERTEFRDLAEAVFLHDLHVGEVRLLLGSTRDAGASCRKESGTHCTLHLFHYISSTRMHTNALYSKTKSVYYSPFPLYFFTTDRHRCELQNRMHIGLLMYSIVWCEFKKRKRVISYSSHVLP